jgi:hypothetical protein
MLIRRNAAINNYDANQGHILEWMSEEEEIFAKRSQRVTNDFAHRLVEIFTGKTTYDIDNMQTFINHYSYN